MSYHFPHKFRHGHAVYALKMARDIPALKAVSQNMMHSNLSVTDGIYGMLSDTDIKMQIAALGHQSTTSKKRDFEELNLLTKQLMDKLGIDKQ